MWIVYWTGTGNDDDHVVGIYDEMISEVLKKLSQEYDLNTLRVFQVKGEWRLEEEVRLVRRDSEQVSVDTEDDHTLSVLKHASDQMAMITKINNFPWEDGAYIDIYEWSRGDYHTFLEAVRSEGHDIYGANARADITSGFLQWDVGFRGGEWFGRDKGFILEHPKAHQISSTIVYNYYYGEEC